MFLLLLGIKGNYQKFRILSDQIDIVYKVKGVLRRKSVDLEQS